MTATGSRPNAVELLVTQHRLMEKMFDELLDEALEGRAERFAKAADELVSHFMIEEEIFYPAVRMERTEDILLESLEEHLSLKRVLDDLLGLDLDDPRFTPKMHVLEEQVRHHHKEEEEDLFPKVQKCMHEDRLETLGTQMYARQQELLRSGCARMRVRTQTEESAALPGSTAPASV